MKYAEKLMPMSQSNRLSIPIFTLHHYNYRIFDRNSNRLLLLQYNLMTLEYFIIGCDLAATLMMIYLHIKAFECPTRIISALDLTKKHSQTGFSSLHLC